MQKKNEKIGLAERATKTVKRKNEQEKTKKKQILIYKNLISKETKNPKKSENAEKRQETKKKQK